MSSRFDIIVYGATGFTGSLVARYLITESESSFGNPGGFKWAIAGRNKVKMMQLKELLKEKLSEIAPSLIDEIPIIVADSGDEKSLASMVQSTKVVMSLVGPYKLYGELLVKACAEYGVHYCDLTGEIIWIKEMTIKYAAVAAKSGAILVNCCGFESIPSDLTTFLVADRIQQKYKTITSTIDLYFTDIKGEASGGTMASVFAIMEMSTNKQLLASRNPYFLTDETTILKKQQMGLVAPNTSGIGVHYDKIVGLWHSWFIGGTVNQAIVHRSNYLLQNKYGDTFVYHERMAIGGLFIQLLTTIGTVFMGILLYFGWTRALLKRLSPAPGQGPSEETMLQGYFVAQAVGYSNDGKLVVKAKTVGSGDPGYRLTSRLISECAFCLAKSEFNESISLQGGFYTPASAFGHKLANRLHSKKFLTFELKDMA
ncbi:saccharopine dehydrogenase [Plasmopara halstedii]|uniref:Saccharopine dehydrogenase n=1 Tax=Plasmopara halstedii TaxID=4781 RepID=A0A0P1AGC4_PLAHL|nr:saccharopine dehydrogenase [Plasmopara halstedii]CEG39964.1 saccharopine dehydrogenase [Plasmopara halstedii]|eukprot:XP_024576333.1 saccharopine dehydrogenase [Plasmopara halstedii]